MQFDRTDVCEAWFLYLSKRPEQSARLSRLSRHFTPSRRVRGARDLSSNALEIYLKLIGNELPLVDEGWEGAPIFEMWAGAYGTTKALVRADSFESAFEAFTEYLDDHAPGMLTWCDYDAAARELGYPSAIDVPEADYHKLDELAEMDMSVVGHTTLKNGNAIPSWEWGGQEADI